MTLDFYIGRTCCERLPLAEADAIDIPQLAALCADWFSTLRGSAAAIVVRDERGDLPIHTLIARKRP